MGTLYFLAHHGDYQQTTKRNYESIEEEVTGKIRGNGSFSANGIRGTIMRKGRDGVEEFIALAREKAWPMPPLAEIMQAKHYWLKDRPQDTGSANSPQYMVAQWSPLTCEWYRSNEVATSLPPLGNLAGWYCVAAIELPEE